MFGGIGVACFILLSVYIGKNATLDDSVKTVYFVVAIIFAVISLLLGVL